MRFVATLSGRASSARQKMGSNDAIYFCTRRCGLLLGKRDIDCLVSSRGIKELRVNVLKMDPYINVDPGTTSPIQHGEVS